MSWVCGVCSSNNLDESTTCEICGEARPAAATAPKSTSVCTLTQSRAKEKCKYADVTVPDEYNVIGENAFKGRTDLYTIRIHSGVNKIMKGAFDGCTNLYSVYVDGHLSSIGSRAFADCKYLSPERRPTADTVASDAFVGCSPTPIGTPSRNVGARPTTKKTTTSSGSSYGKTSGTRPSTSTGSSGTGFSTEFSKTSGGTSRGTGTTSTATRTAPTPPPRPSYTPPPPPRKTTPPPPSKPSPDSFEARFNALPLCMAIAFMAFVALFLFTDWGLLATRQAWQTAGGLAAIFCVGMLTHNLFYKEDYGAIGWTLSFMSVFSGAVWLFNGVDTTLAVILSGGICILSLIYSCIAFSNVETGSGWWIFILAILNFVNLVAVMIRFGYFVNGALWQVLIAEVIVIMLFVFVRNLIDETDYSSLIVLTVLGLVIVGFVLWIFGCHATHFVSVLSLGLIFANVVGAVSSFDDYETGCGVGFIIVGVLQAVTFALTHLVYA